MRAVGSGRRIAAALSNAGVSTSMSSRPSLSSRHLLPGSTLRPNSALADDKITGDEPRDDENPAGSRLRRAKSYFDRHRRSEASFAALLATFQCWLSALMRGKHLPPPLRHRSSAGRRPARRFRGEAALANDGGERRGRGEGDRKEPDRSTTRVNAIKGRNFRQHREQVRRQCNSRHAPVAPHAIDKIQPPFVQSNLDTATLHWRPRMPAPGIKQFDILRSGKCLVCSNDIHDLY